MAEDNDVLNRADSLMTRAEGSFIGGRRRRTFIAAPQADFPENELAAQQLQGALQDYFLQAGSVMPRLEEVVFPEMPPSEDEDLPVLTEIVAPEPAVSEPAPEDPFNDTLVEILVADIAHAIEQQLAIELPTLIEASLLTVKEELRAGISATMEIALRDFLARRQQLRLPLDEPKRDE